MPASTWRVLVMHACHRPGIAVDAHRILCARQLLAKKYLLMLYFAPAYCRARLHPSKMNMRKFLVIAAVVIAAAAVFAFRLILVVIGSAVYLYLLPGLVARDRAHPRQQDIQIVCALSGWLIVPWVIGLWVALQGPVKAPLFGKPALTGSFDD
jgi:Superinfection immunity protein